MKKLIILMFIVFAAFTINAQDIILNNGQTYKVYTGKSGDTLSATTTSIDVDMYLKNPEFLDEWYKYDIYVDMDSSGDGTNATVILQGSWDNSTWTSITSVTWYMSSTDTTIRYNNLSYDYATTATGIYASAAYSITTVDSLLYDDTLHVPAITVTDARVQTYVYNLISYPYLRIYATGAGAGARAELQAVRAKFIKPINY